MYGRGMSPAEAWQAEKESAQQRVLPLDTQSATLNTPQTVPEPSTARHRSAAPRRGQRSGVDASSSQAEREVSRARAVRAAALQRAMKRSSGDGYRRPNVAGSEATAPQQERQLPRCRQVRATRKRRKSRQQAARGALRAAAAALAGREASRRAEALAAPQVPRQVAVMHDRARRVSAPEAVARPQQAKPVPPKQHARCSSQERR